MEITESIFNRTLGITIKGSINSNTAGELESRLEEIDLDKIDKVIFDFSDVDYLSSKGIRILITLYKKIKSNGKQLELINLNESVREVFRLSGLLQVFNIQ